ncbi:MAG: RNA-binding domain-containing protein [Syntrophales bacterium]
MPEIHLPINIDVLINGRTVEGERLEFKKGWNPEAVIHTLCAFANDFHNLGGGYIVIGIEERDGRPMLPPVGIPAGKIDKIQKEILTLGYRMQPVYHPVIAPYVIQDRHLLVLWAPGGQTRPYKAPVSLAKEAKEFAYYIRKASATVRPTHGDEMELIGLTATVPFDDRIAHQASIDDLNLALIRDFLREVGSKLYDDVKDMGFAQLCRQMHIVSGAMEMLKPLNVGLLFFNENPARFFPQAQIDVVQFPDGPGGDVFTEKIFKGPLNRIVKEALAYVNAVLIEEIVVKKRGKPEAERFFNYPYEALEEALVNAVYHRSYEIREPIEVRILPDCVTIASYPGPDHSVNLADLQTGRSSTRRYRNRRIGEFLKELNLTEGRGTGIPKILRAIRKNGSPLPIFETDDDRLYFVSRFPIHPGAKQRIIKEDRAETEKTGTKSGPSRDQVGTKSEPNKDDIRQILSRCNTPQGVTDLMAVLTWTNRTKFRNKYLNFLIGEGLLEMTIPDKPQSSLQKYRVTEKGKVWLEGQQ